MKNLLLNLDDWRARLAHEPLALFLDYDGTLSAIAPTPAEACLSFGTQAILKALVRLKNVKVAIISGRSLSDLQNMVSVRGLSYVGSHGIEFRTPGHTPRRVSKKYLRNLQELKQRLQGELRGLPGILFEEKPFSFAIHYRKTTSAVEKKVQKMVLDECSGAVHQGQIAVISGKKVIEIMPPHAMNKGRAAQRLLGMWGKKKWLPIFIGDDRTDEAAFEVLRDRGLTVKVGNSNSRSRAEYNLDSVDDVRTFLRTILYFRTS